jgi:hypothetical protein
MMRVARVAPQGTPRDAPGVGPVARASPRIPRAAGPMILRTAPDLRDHPVMRHSRVATPYGPQALSGGGHHHGGGRIPPFVYGGPWYNPGVQLFTVDDPLPPPSACPKVRQPVLASDGLVYDNACLARAAGVKVVRAVAQPPAGPLKGFGAWSASIQSDGSLSSLDVTTKRAFWAGFAAGVASVAVLRLLIG